MPRVRTRPIHPYIQHLMDLKGVSTIKELSDATGLPYQTLSSWAGGDGKHQQFEAALKASRALGVSLEEFVSGLLLENSDSVLSA